MDLLCEVYSFIKLHQFNKSDKNIASFDEILQIRLKMLDYKSNHPIDSVNKHLRISQRNKTRYMACFAPSLFKYRNII